MPKSALPEHINDPEEINQAFPDDSQYGSGLFGRFYKWIHKETKTWFVFSYRCPEKWAKWRKVPVVLLSLKGQGPWRLERTGTEFYLSRIQYYTRWHFAIQWPLMISFHWYPQVADVPIAGEPLPELDGKVWFGYWNHFDADLVYWMLCSIFIGRNWK